MKDNSRLPRLLVFLNSTARGGVEEVALALAKGLSVRNWEVHLAAPAELLESYGADLEGEAVTRFPIRLASFRQWGEIRRFAGYLRQRRIQIVNSHMFYATLHAAPVARLVGVPVVIETTHGPEAWRTSWWKRKYWVDRWIERLVTFNVAVSEANRRYLREVKRYPAHKLHVIVNGCDPSRYQASEEQARQLRTTLRLDPQDRVVLIAARLEAQKGHRYLIPAIPAVLAREPRARFVLAGEGSLRGELEQAVEAAGVAHAVRFAGLRKEMAPFYRMSEFVLLPSLYEGMPLVAIEAGAAGRAVIATRVDGTIEVIEEGTTGVLVPPADTGALEEAILHAFQDQHRTRCMGELARQRIQAKFSLEAQLDTANRLYRSCLAAQHDKVKSP